MIQIQSNENVHCMTNKDILSLASSSISLVGSFAGLLKFTYDWTPPGNGKPAMMLIKKYLCISKEEARSTNINGLERTNDYCTGVSTFSTHTLEFIETVFLRQQKTNYKHVQADIIQRFMSKGMMTVHHSYL